MKEETSILNIYPNLGDVDNLDAAFGRWPRELTPQSGV